MFASYEKYEVNEKAIILKRIEEFVLFRFSTISLNQNMEMFL